MLVFVRAGVAANVDGSVGIKLDGVYQSIAYMNATATLSQATFSVHAVVSLTSSSSLAVVSTSTAAPASDSKVTLIRIG